MRDRPIIVWFRRDLRVGDHAALWHAAKAEAPIVPVFIADHRLIADLPSDGSLFDFQAACLQELDATLRHYGNALIIRYGIPEIVMDHLIRELQPRAIYYNRDYEPYARERDARIEALARRYGIEVLSFKDHVLVEPWEIATLEGAPYTRYTPFYRAWQKLPKPRPYGKPKRLLPGPEMPSEPIPTAERLGKPVTLQRWAVTPGETSARTAWDQYLRTGLPRYRETRDFPALPDGSSRMSPHLRFGTISIRRLYADATDLLEASELSASERTSVERFIAELAWREFFQHILWHFPHVAERSFRDAMERFPWENREDYFRAWCEGRTGYPFVDAAMRQLNATGYMPNRARMVAASFLVKDLRIDWRWGERYFRSKLLDGEIAANAGNWQWVASTGVDARPLRIFNPVVQSRRYDPDGRYIRQWVPELGSLPAEYLHEPWRMSPLEQESYGVRLGVDYPLPIVEHAERKRQFESAYARLRSGERE